MTTLRKILTGAAGAAILAAFATGAAAQTPTSTAPSLQATATATMSATIQSPLTVEKESDLAFGTLLKPVSGSAVTATLSPDGELTYTGGNKTGTPTAATFTVTSSSGTVFTPTATATGAITSLTAWALDDSANENGEPITIASGETTHTLKYGASFSLAPDTPVGVYNGSLSVVVNYQ